MRTIFAALVALHFAGCSQAEPDAIEFNLDVSAVDDRARGIPGIEVRIGDTRIGETSDSGHLGARVRAYDGQSFEFHAQCPDGFSSSEIPEKVVFRDTQGLEGKNSQRMNFEIRCTRRERVVAVLVHADGQSDMPVLVDGQPSGKTDAMGFAHLRLDLQPHTQFEISLDSSRSPELLPASPRQLMVVGEQDSLFIFEPSFVKAPPPPQKKRRKRRKKTVENVVEKQRPVRIN